MDDCHACIDAIKDGLTITLPKAHSAYQRGNRGQICLPRTLTLTLPGLPVLLHGLLGLQILIP